MRAGVLDDPPPVQVEAILLEVELLLQFDAGYAEERGKFRRHRVGQIDHCLEGPPCRYRTGAGLDFAWRIGLRFGRHNDRGGEARGSRAREKSAAAQRCVQRLLASWNTHDRPPCMLKCNFPAFDTPSIALGPAGRNITTP